MTVRGNLGSSSNLLRDTGIVGRVAVAQGGLVGSADELREWQDSGPGGPAMRRHGHRPDDAVTRR